MTWDDVTLEPNLWDRAVSYVQSLSLPRSVTVSAIDMSDAGHSVDAFDVGQMVALDALDTQGTMQVTGITWDLLDPSGGSIDFGAASVTSSSRTAQTSLTADAALFVAGGAARPKASATFVGTDTTTTATANNWKAAPLDTIAAAYGSPSDWFAFASGTLTAMRACTLAVSGVMTWRDNVAGMRGIGISEGGGISGGSMTGTEHSVFTAQTATTGNYYRTVAFPRRLFRLAEGGTLTVGHWEPTGGVYYNGNGHTWLTVEVVG